MSPENKFPFGVSYSPLIFSEQDWEQDLKLMRAASMNVVRVGDVHGSWDRLEPREGEFQLEKIQRFFERANKYGIQVMLSTGAASPPLWLAMKYPDVLILSSRGERYPLGASYHWACIHHPGYLAATQSYLQRLVEFAMQQPNHFGWQISNEIGFPFMPARDRNDLGLYCYCDHCQHQFQLWLQKKYQTIEALTEAWSWSTTNFVYNLWNEVRAPESLPFSWSGVTRWIDWRLFWQEAFANFAGWQHQTIRKIDPCHPTSVNTFNFKGFDRFGTYMGLDQWKIAQKVDHIGYDLYPGSGNKLKSRPEHNSIFLDHGRSVAQSAGSDFWIHELESGPIGGWVLGPDHNTDAADVINQTIETLGHDAKLILYMPWREWNYQPLHWGALVDFDGAPTTRYEAVSSLGAWIRDNSEFLLAAQPPAAEVAILESKPNAIFFRGVDQEEVLFDAQRGAYRAFWEKGNNVDFITPAQLFDKRIFNYRFIVLPLIGLMSTEEAEQLKEYVSRGGILVGFSRCATLDEKGWYHNQLPVQALASLFGLKHVSADQGDKQTINLNGNSFRTWLNRDQVEAEAKTEVLARFEDGLPAITLSHYNSGYGVYIATQADGGYVNSGDGLLGEVLTLINKCLSIKPVLQVECSVNRAVGIDAHLLEKDNRSMLLVSNYYEGDLDAVIHILQSGQRPVKVEEKFPSCKLVDWVSDEGGLAIKLKFANKEVKIIEIIWEQS